MKDMRKVLAGQVLAMMPSAIEAYRHMLGSVDAGVLREVEAAEAVRAAGGVELAAATQAGAVAVIPVYGMIQQRRDIFMAIFGGTSMVGLSNSLRSAVEDATVKAIVLDFNTPGGSVYGVTEVARQIRAARGAKPIVSVVNSLCASAGYWLASSADEIVGTPSSEAGSIGAFMVHVNEAKAAEKEGYEVTLFSAGDLKPAASGMSSLTDEERAGYQARVDSFYSMEVGDVATSRGVTAEAVRRGYGRGGVLGATAAKDARMIDRIATLDETLSRLGSPAGRRASIPRGGSGAGRLAARVHAYSDDPDIRRRQLRLSASAPPSVARAEIDQLLQSGGMDPATEIRLRTLRLSLSETA